MTKAKTVRCPGCRVWITVEINPMIGGAQIRCSCCENLIWVPLGNVDPVVLSRKLDPSKEEQAEAILAQVLPHAAQPAQTA